MVPHLFEAGENILKIRMSTVWMLQLATRPIESCYSEEWYVYVRAVCEKKRYMAQKEHHPSVNQFINFKTFRLDLGPMVPWRTIHWTNL